jgi:Zn finger protein HypA/HybF involved in hydrogenase expression
MNALKNEEIEEPTLVESQRKARCRNCNSEIEVDEDSITAYCEFCQSEVFVRGD